MLAYSILGLVAGTFSGLVGIGGGIILVPALVYLFQMNQHMAQGSTLMLFCIPVSLLGALHYYREGHVDLKVVGLIALGFIVGSLLGAKLAMALPSAILKKIFAVVLVVVGLRMLWER